jgi:hypothetical protein
MVTLLNNIVLRVVFGEQLIYSRIFDQIFVINSDFISLLLVEYHYRPYLWINHALNDFSPATFNHSIMAIIVQLPFPCWHSHESYIVIPVETNQTWKFVALFGRFRCVEICHLEIFREWQVKLEKIVLQNVSLVTPYQIESQHTRRYAFDGQ